MFNYLPSGTVNFLLNPKDEQVTPNFGEANVKGGMAATVPPPQPVVKEEDEGPIAAVPLAQSAVKEENENRVAAVSIPQSVIKEDQEPAAAIPVSPLVAKKEPNRPAVTVPHFQSAVKGDEKEKPVASAPPSRSAARENIPKHAQNASSGERPAKKLKLTQETVQSLAPAVPEKKPFELTSRQAVSSLNCLMLQLYSTYYYCFFFSFDVLGDLVLSFIIEY